MKIGELIIQLGVKGSDSAKKALTGTRAALSDISATSIETKAAILGVIYGLERMMSFGVKMGTDLRQFAQLTNMSTEALQRWQYAGRQVGISNESVEGSFKAVQQAMGNMLIGKGAPEGMGMLANMVGFDAEKAQDTVYVMKKLQEFAVKAKGNAALSNTVLRSFGLNDEMIIAMKQMAFNKERMARAPVFTPKEIQSLSQMGIKLREMQNQFNMAIGSLVAEYFPPIVDQLDKLGQKATAFVQEVVKVARVPVTEVFQTIAYFVNQIAEGWKAIFAFIQDVTGVAITIKGIFEGISDTAKFLKDIYSTFKGDDEAGLKKKYGEGGIWGAIKEVGKGMIMDTPLEKAFAPTEPMKGVAPNNNQKVEINQNINFTHDGKDAMQTKNDFQKVMESTIRQMPQGAY